MTPVNSVDATPMLYINSPHLSIVPEHAKCGLPNAECGIVNPVKTHSIRPNPAAYRIA